MLQLPAKKARRLVLRKQWLTASNPGAKPRTLVEVASGLASVQYDPLPVIAPNHYMVFWNRLSIGGGTFHFDELDEALYQSHTLMEFFGLRRVTSIIPSSEFPLYRSAARLALEQGWTRRLQRRIHSATARRLLERVRREGPVTKRDLESEEERKLLYALFRLVPEVVIVKRRPGLFREAEYAWGPEAMPHVDFETQMELDEAVSQLLLRVVRAFGLCTARHAAFWLGCRVREVDPYMRRLVGQEQLVPVRVGEQRSIFYATPEDLEWLEATWGRDEGSAASNEVHLLTPLDNLVRDRIWLARLFGYTFRIEYFQVKGMRWHTSILVGEEFVGFIDPKADRRSQEFIVKEVVLRRQLDPPSVEAILTRFLELAAAHRCSQVRLLKTPPSWDPALRELGATKEQKATVLPVPR